MTVYSKNDVTTVSTGTGKIVIDRPQQSLVDFAIYQESRISSDNKNYDAVANLPVDDLQMFAQSACARAANLSDLRVAVYKQLRNKVPDDVYEDIADRAFIPELQNNVIHFTDTTSKITTDGNAYSYLGFVHTQQNKHYAESCMVISGLRIKVGTMIAGYENSTEQVLLHYKKTNCGIFRCEEEPVYKTRITHFPIFKQAVLSFEEQLRLRTHMIANGVEAALSLSKPALDKQHISPAIEGRFNNSWPIINPK